MRKDWSIVKKNFNRSYTYLMPMLGIVYDQFKNVKACFVGDEDKPQYQEHLFVLHKKDDTEESYYKSLESHPMFVERYMVDLQHEMFVFEIPDSQIDNYRKFRDSKFSRMSNEYKQHLKSFFRILNNHPVMKILNRDEKYRKALEESLGVVIDKEAEVASVLDMEVEIFRDWMKVKEVNHEIT